MGETGVPGLRRRHWFGVVVVVAGVGVGVGVGASCATVGDFFAKPAVKGGLGLGTYGASAVLLAVLGGLMAYMVIRERRRTVTELLPVV